MGTLRQPSLDGGPLLKHTSLPNLLYLYVYLYVSFNHSLPLATAWQFGSLHEISLDVEPFTKFANDVITFDVQGNKCNSHA